MSCSKAGLLFSDDVLRLWLQPVKDDLQSDFTLVADEADCPVVLTPFYVAFFRNVMTIDLIHGAGKSPVCQISLQVAVMVLVIASIPACINSADMLSIPAGFPFCSLHFFTSNWEVILFGVYRAIQYCSISFGLAVV